MLYFLFSFLFFIFWISILARRYGSILVHFFVEPLVWCNISWMNELVFFIYWSMFVNVSFVCVYVIQMVTPFRPMLRFLSSPFPDVLVKWTKRRWNFLYVCVCVCFVTQPPTNDGYLWSSVNCWPISHIRSPIFDDRSLRYCFPSLRMDCLWFPQSILTQSAAMFTHPLPFHILWLIYSIVHQSQVFFWP